MPFWNSLAREGRVELILNRWAFVANPSLEEGRGIFVIRAALERGMVRQLAGRIDAAAIERLTQMVEAETRLARKATWRPSALRESSISISPA